VSDRQHGLLSKFREGLRVEEKLVGVSGAALRVAEAGNGVLLGTVQEERVVVNR
jgi:hypothetical protein